MIMFSLSISCNKNESLDEEKQILFNKKTEKSYLLKLPIKEQVEYANSHLLKLGIIFDKLWHQDSFKSIILDEMRKKVNKGYDAEILFKDILSILEKSNDIKYSELDYYKIKNEIEAFQGILKDNKLEPQVFIPFFVKNEKKLRLTNNKSTNDTKYVLTTEPNEPTEVKVYIENNGQLQELPDKINEQDAILIDDLIALGLNEFNPNDEIDYNPLIIQDTISVNPVNPSQGNISSEISYDLWLSRMKITKHKEPWYKGGSEVHFSIKGITGNNNGHIVNYTNGQVFNEEYQVPINVTASLAAGKGKCFAFWTRKQVNNGVVKERNRIMAKNFCSSAYISPIYFPDGISKNYEAVRILVFEYDTWPAAIYESKVFQPMNGILSNSEPNLYNDGTVYNRGDDKYPYVHGRTWNDYYASYVVFNIPYTQLNEVSPGFYNCDDTDEVIQTSPFNRDGLPYIKHISVQHN